MVSKIREDFKNRIIFDFCRNKARLGIKVVGIEFSLTKNQIDAKMVLPGIAREITIDADFTSTFPTSAPKTS